MGVADPPKNRDSALLPQKHDRNAPQTGQRRVPNRVNRRRGRVNRIGGGESIASEGEEGRVIVSERDAVLHRRIRGVSADLGL